MYLEEQYPVKLISEETGVGKSTISAWTRTYKMYGEDGLRRQISPSGKKKRINKAVENKIVDLKKSHPHYGSRRISDILKRFFFIKTSPSTVHKALSDKDLVTKRPVKPKKNPAKQRFFERSKPNQLWQSDICTFRLAGKNAYLIGFIDDYSRYINLYAVNCLADYLGIKNLIRPEDMDDEPGNDIVDGEVEAALG